MRRSFVLSVSLTLVLAGVCAAEAQVAAPTPNVIEVSVKGQRNEARRRQESAEAVTVIDLKQAKQQSADLGEVLARTQGVSVRRTGGLGSSAVIALNGLQGEQIRTFVDGIPIELAGYPFGIANIPVNVVERVEIYRGVVPARFGADTLGGAINVVTTRGSASYLNASYQTGSYGVHRLNTAGRDQHEGYFAGGNLFMDLAKNNFVMSDRALMQPDGSSIYKDVRRFHDGYRAYGGQLELGAVDKPWARRVVLRGFASTFDKDIQTNAVMSVPYGKVTTGESTSGASLQYEAPLFSRLDLEFLLNYAYRNIGFRDMSRYRYDWRGQISRPVGGFGQVGYGEIESKPYDQETHQNLVMGRLGLVATFSAQHAARLYVTPQFVRRSEHDFVEGRANLDLDSRVVQLVGGLEYEQTLLDAKLSNVAFAKYYLFKPKSDVPIDRDGNGRPERVSVSERSASTWGAGDSLRYRFARWLIAKASYEYAVRLPNPDELFGNGVLIRANAELQPERSHNANLSPRFEKRATPAGDFVIDVNAFWRETRDQIVLIATQNFAPYRNVADARTVGAEGSLWWQSPGQWLILDGTFTLMDSRNNSEKGPFAAYKGERIPSRPYRFASWGSRFHVHGLPKSEDTLDVFYLGRFVNGFYRGWESLGNPQFKMSLPNQHTHALGVTYSHVFREGRYGFTFEVDNLTNAELFDVWGVQRPGRSFNVKITSQL